MTNLLLRLFVKDHRNTADPRVRAAIGSLSGTVGICCNALLFLMKLIVGALTGSVSITADALNNLSDASGSILTLVGFRLADKPADEHHPYGHARAEYLSGLAVAVLILFIGFELVKSSVDKIFHPSPVTFSAPAAGVLVASIGVKLWMALFNRDLGKRIGSTTLAATSADSRNDCVATSAVLLAAIIEHTLDLRIDGYIGLGVAAFILYSGWNLAKDTISPLLGENADPELQEKIVDYIQAQPKVLGYHDLMVHDYGPGQRFASLHVEMDAREDPLECHELIDDMERECLNSHNVHLVIHYDPVITDDPELRRLKEEVAALLRTRDRRLSLHDFRMVQGRRHMNLVFDVALPSDLRQQGAQIRQWLEDTLNETEPAVYHVKITYDTAAPE
ncbi:MAG: cation diffusion facilitator family transporter [Oscillospiraceae bacterium]|nr:cation diffusion facilitator family transporter [Oscillospiraceae bacterium]